MEINKLERKKTFILMCWVIYSGFILWLLNMLDSQSFNISSLFNFILLLLGGSTVVYYMTEMYRTPINEKNDKKWDAFSKYLLYSAFMILFTVGIAYFEKYIYSLGGLITFPSMFVTIFVLPKFAGRAHLVFSEIKNS